MPYFFWCLMLTNNFIIAQWAVGLWLVGSNKIVSSQ